jgi:hypothetical protein
MLECVSNDGPAAEIRRVNPQWQLAALDLFVQGVEGDAGLDETGAVVGVDVEDLVHAAAEVDDYGAADAWCCAAVAHWASCQ